MSQEGEIRLTSRSFSVVGFSFLMSRRGVFEASGVPLYLVVSRDEGGYQVRAVDYPWLDALPPAQRDQSEFVVARQWARLADTAPEPGAASFLTRWNSLLDLSPEERIERLASARADFEAARGTSADTETLAPWAAGLTETAFLVNRASIALGGPGAGSPALVAETVAVVRAVLQLIEDNPRAVAVIRNLASPSGSQTLDHIVRVFTLVSGFELHLRRIHSAGLAARLRVAFPAHYLPAYRDLLPRLGPGWLRSDNVVRLPALTAEQIRIHALGALLHDIGMVHDLDYFETSTRYDEATIRRHPLLGAGLFLRTYGTAYDDARTVIAEHHNSLFHPEGYGVLRLELQRSGREPQPQCSVADTLVLYQSGAALCYLPVEVCALADIYDALTQPHRPTQKAITPAEALELMQSRFVREKRLDPVLFDLWTDYLGTLGVEVPPGIGFTAKVYPRNTSGQPK